MASRFTFYWETGKVPDDQKPWGGVNGKRPGILRILYQAGMVEFLLRFIDLKGIVLGMLRGLKSKMSKVLV